MNNLKIYLPNIYNEVLEFDEVMNTEQQLFGTAENYVTTTKLNQYVLTCDETGIALFEKQLDILANTATEDLEFRRQRVLNRLSTKPPFTMNYLKQKLNELIGVGKYNVHFDKSSYTLYVESSASDQMWANEISITLNSIKPANIVYINKPLITNVLAISEEMSYNQIEYNYRLGTSWVLGAKTFGSSENKGVIKLAEVASVEDRLLRYLAIDTDLHVVKVFINDTEAEILEFETKVVNDNIVTIEYVVDPVATGITEITKIALANDDDMPLTTSIVYVPLTSPVTIKHTLTLKEGV